MTDVYISKGISLKEVQDGKINPIDAYKIILNTFILNPVKYLAETHEVNNGIAIFILLLVFFEPHGKLLTGNIKEQGSSKSNFIASFSDFLIFLNEKQKNKNQKIDIDPKLFYEWARCGLFHSARMGKEMLLIDRIIESPSIIKNSGNPDWLINPWQLINDIESYNDSYIERLSKEECLFNNFNKSFNFLVLERASHYYPKNKTMEEKES